MKKLLLTAACLLIAGNAGATTINVTSMQFWDISGAYVSTDAAVTGTIDFTTLANSTTIDSGQLFNGANWQATVAGVWETGTVNFSGTYLGTAYTYNYVLQAGEVGAQLLFDWPLGTGAAIPVMAIFGDADNDGNWIAVNTDGDLAPGTKMLTKPFKNNTAAFYGVTSAVPEPASMLLIGSGLAGLLGVARKRKS